MSLLEAMVRENQILYLLFFRLKNHYPAEYNNILKAVQLIAPYFKNFELEPSEYNREHRVATITKNI